MTEVNGSRCKGPSWHREPKSGFLKLFRPSTLLCLVSVAWTFGHTVAGSVLEPRTHGILGRGLCFSLSPHIPSTAFRRICSPKITPFRLRSKIPLLCSNDRGKESSSDRRLPDIQTSQRQGVGRSIAALTRSFPSMLQSAVLDAAGAASLSKRVEQLTGAGDYKVYM